MNVRFQKEMFTIRLDEVNVENVWRVEEMREAKEKVGRR